MKKLSSTIFKKEDKRLIGNKFALGNKPNQTSFKKGEHKGNKNLAWQGGKSFEPYGEKFNDGLKEQIRKRDNYRCQECFRHEKELRTRNNKKYKLNIHHIDFIKNNNNINNLISLCRVCHGQTQFDRNKWIIYYQNKINMVGHLVGAVI